MMESPPSRRQTAKNDGLSYHQLSLAVHLLTSPRCFHRMDAPVL